MNIEDILKYSYISLNYAYLKIFVNDINIFEPLFNLTKISTDVNGDIINVPDLDKRKIYNIPDFIECIQKSNDRTFHNCLLVMVLDGYTIEELHNWIQYYNETYNK